jgi:hypothetical protein
MGYEDINKTIIGDKSIGVRINISDDYVEQLKEKAAVHKYSASQLSD